MPHIRVVLHGRATPEPSSIDSLQKFADAPPLSPFSLLTFVRKAAVPEIHSVEERENVRPGCRNRLLFQRENKMFSVMMKYCNKKELASKEMREASLT